MTSRGRIESLSWTTSCPSPIDPFVTAAAFYSVDAVFWATGVPATARARPACRRAAEAALHARRETHPLVVKLTAFLRRRAHPPRARNATAAVAPAGSCARVRRWSPSDQGGTRGGGRKNSSDRETVHHRIS